MDPTFKGHKAYNQQKKAQGSRNNYSFCIKQKEVSEVLCPCFGIQPSFITERQEENIFACL